MENRNKMEGNGLLTAASLFSWKHGGRQEFLLLDFSGKAPFVFVRFASKCNRLAACFNLLPGRLLVQWPLDGPSRPLGMAGGHGA